MLETSYYPSRAWDNHSEQQNALMSSGAGRSFSLDIYRAVACGMIVIYHLPPRVSSPLGLGQAAMELFFVLSGYLISQSLTRSVRQEGLAGVLSFTIRRIRRLLPGMLGFLVGGCLLNVFLASTGYSEILWASIAAVTGWYNFHQCFGDPLVIGFGGIWSLSLEEQFYFSSVMMVLVCWPLWQKSGQWLFIWAGLLLAIGISFRTGSLLKIIEWRSDYLAYMPPLRTWGFGIGVLVAALSDLNCPPFASISTRTAGWFVAFCIAAIVVLIDSVDGADVSPFMFQWALVPVLGGVVLLMSAQVDNLLSAAGRRQETWPAPGAWVARLAGTSIRLLGKASYSVYLWHCLVIAAFARLGVDGAGYGWLLMLVASLLSGVLSWQFIEKRFYNFS